MSDAEEDDENFSEVQPAATSVLGNRGGRVINAVFGEPLIWISKPLSRSSNTSPTHLV
jgi:hypothetical protein